MSSGALYVEMVHISGIFLPQCVDFLSLEKLMGISTPETKAETGSDYRTLTADSTDESRANII